MLRWRCGGNQGAREADFAEYVSRGSLIERKGARGKRGSGTDYELTGFPLAIEGGKGCEGAD